MKVVAFVTAIVLGAVGIQRAVGRNIDVLTYDELFARSDFIVIAEVAEKTKDTPERTKLTDISPPQSAIGVVTTFQCLHVIKGSRRQHFTLHHYRVDPSVDDFHRQAPEGTERVIVNGPTFQSFGLEPGKPAYLMFLIRERDLSIFKLNCDSNYSPNQPLRPTAGRSDV
jgi:hypothetical protein